MTKQIIVNGNNVAITNPIAKAEKEKQKGKRWKNLSTNEKIDYLAAKFGIDPETIL